MKGKHSQVNYGIYAKQKRDLENINIAVENLSNISKLIANTTHIFNCSFSFFEEKNHACIKYHIDGSLKLICQESLEQFDYPISVSNSIIITEDDRLVQDSLHEPFICESAIIDLQDIIKEEILLELPMAPKKDSSSCKKTKKHSYYSEQEIVTEEKVNPFEVLKKLK
ncbi:YceD family protein [Francisella sp. XLW-1]|uniref:YceD family protein n=1 Tax=Francisella sp. XLW-1 TaxID=2610887 RepID=UPI00123E0F41|nr:DUF177 domain-containing protein [Francisella sp. XLW-1]